MPFILPPLGSSRPRMRATTSPLVAAASSLDLNALLSAKRPALLETDAEGHTVLHALLVTMFSEKGGQIARLVDWRANTSRRTIYRYDVLRAVARQARPAIHRILQVAPARQTRGRDSASRRSTWRRITTCRRSSRRCRRRRRRRRLGGGRTPVDEAMHNGNFEALVPSRRCPPRARGAPPRRRVRRAPGSGAREVTAPPARRAAARPMAEGADDGAAAAACDATGGWGAPLGGAAGEAARSAQWGRDIDLGRRRSPSPSCTNRTPGAPRCCSATPSRSPNAARSRRRRRLPRRRDAAPLRVQRHRLPRDHGRAAARRAGADGAPTYRRGEDAAGVQLVLARSASRARWRWRSGAAGCWRGG